MGIFEKKINFNNIPFNKIRRWISSKTEKILGREDEIFTSYCINQLTYKIRKSAAEEELQISPNELIKNIEGFLGEKTTEFVSELWEYILRSVDNNENYSKTKSSKNYNSKRNINLKKDFKHSNDALHSSDSYHSINKRLKDDERTIYTCIYRRDPDYTFNRCNSEESSGMFPILTSGSSKGSRRVRSLSRSLSPESYKSYGIENYKYEKTTKMEGNIVGTNHLKGNIDKNEKISEVTSNINKNITFGVEKTFSSDINSLNDKKLESTILTNNKIEEHHLRMKALKLFKRKNEARNCRSESEEILRARAIEKFIKKKPI